MMSYLNFRDSVIEAIENLVLDLDDENLDNIILSIDYDGVDFSVVVEDILREELGNRY